MIKYIIAAVLFLFSGVMAIPSTFLLSYNSILAVLGFLISGSLFILAFVILSMKSVYIYTDKQQVM